MKKNLKSVYVLSAISIIIGLLMAVTNYFTAPIIKKNDENAANDALLIVMPGGKDFEKIDTSSYTLPSSVVEAYKESGGGYVLQLITTGYSSGMTIMCGVDSTGTVTGAVCLSSSETLGYEKTYGEKTVGATLDTIGSVDLISGATLTSKGYRSAVEDALKAFVVFNGGSVDTRTEEEILQDNLNSALFAANGEFENIFVADKLDSVSDVYSAKNGEGYVFVIDETFFGVDKNGIVISETDEKTKNILTNAYNIVSNSKLTEIDISELNLHSNILKVSKSKAGNFVFELRAAGFGINGDEWYNPSGEYIYISLSATEDKEIISIKTASQAETQNLGSVCGNKEFYSQFVGKNDTNYKDIDAISGATITTDGYKNAVGRALEAIDILKGVN